MLSHLFFTHIVLIPQQNRVNPKHGISPSTEDQEPSAVDCKPSAVDQDSLAVDQNSLAADQKSSAADFVRVLPVLSHIYSQLLKLTPIVHFQFILMNILMAPYVEKVYKSVTASEIPHPVDFNLLFSLMIQHLTSNTLATGLYLFLFNVWFLVSLVILMQFKPI